MRRLRWLGISTRISIVELPAGVTQDRRQASVPVTFARGHTFICAEAGSIALKAKEPEKPSIVVHDC